jgi:hypothetical protein
MEWADSLPDHLRLPKTIIQRLETFRLSIGCPEEAFFLRIVGSAWATGKTQQLTYNEAKKENPQADEATLVRIVYEAREMAGELCGVAPTRLPSSCKTLAAFVDLIVRRDAKNASPDPFGWGKEIDNILPKRSP